MAAGFLAWALAGLLAESGAAMFPLLLGAGVLFGAGYGAWLALGPALLAATCAPGQLGRPLGGLAAASGIGGVLGPVLAGPLIATAPVALWLGAAAIALAAAALVVRQGRIS